MLNEKEELQLEETRSILSAKLKDYKTCTCDLLEFDDECNHCEINRALKALGSIKNPHVEVGICHSRTKIDDRRGMHERIFVEEWFKLHDRIGVPPFLEHFLEKENGWEVTKRDKVLATTLIQWLGTNGGQSLLASVERRIKNVKESK